MCRYAFSGPYKHHFACFNCRKAFKQPPIEDYLAVRGRIAAYKELVRHWSDAPKLALREQELGIRLENLRAEYHSAEHKCPECGGLMADLGLDFKPPRQNNARAWKRLQGMYRAGHEWRTCGCNGPGWIPKSTADLRRYLESRKSAYETNLRHTQDNAESPPEARRDAIAYWASRRDAVEKELAALG